MVYILQMNFYYSLHVKQTHVNTQNNLLKAAGACYLIT